MNEWTRTRTEQPPVCEKVRLRLALPYDGESALCTGHRDADDHYYDEHGLRLKVSVIAWKPLTTNDADQP